MKKQTLQLIAAGLLLTLTATAQAQVSIPTLTGTDKYTVLAVAPNSEGLTPQQKQFIETVKLESRTLVEKISGLAGQALTADKGISKIFVNLGETLKADLGARLEKVKGALPEDGIVFSVYVLPWAQSIQPQVQNQALAMIGPVQEEHIDLSTMTKKNAEAEFYAKINSKLRAISLGETDKFQLQSIAFHLKLERGNSQIRVQILGRLKQMSMPFEKVNDKVSLKQVEIFGDETKQERPMALINITQALQDKSALPEIVLEFGQFGGVSGGLLGWRGAYQILSNPWKENDCTSKLNSVPALTGTLVKTAIANPLMRKVLGGVVSGMPIKFRLLNLRINAETLKVEKMNLAIEVKINKLIKNFPQCLTAESVNQQFMGEANAAIEDQLNTLYKQDDMTDDLMSALYN